MSTTKNVVVQSKDWLKDWYGQRLPILKLEHLFPQINRGLSTPYQVAGKSDTDESIKLPKRLDGVYLSPVDTVKVKSGELTTFPNGMVVVRDGDWRDVTGTTIHEYTHATHVDENGNFNYDFVPGATKQSFSSKYMMKPWEQHAFLMELRKFNKLDPKKTDYTLDDLNQIRQHDQMSNWIIQQLLDSGMKEEDVVNALNTWAHNSKGFQIDETYAYAKFGGKLNYFDCFK